MAVPEGPIMRAQKRLDLQVRFTQISTARDRLARRIHSVSRHITSNPIIVVPSKIMWTSV